MLIPATVNKRCGTCVSKPTKRAKTKERRKSVTTGCSIAHRKPAVVYV